MQVKTSKLLVVDDEEPNRDLLSRRLRKAGFAVECACSAKEALEVLKREQIDLVLLDNMMPEMSGIDLLKLLRATQSASELPVIMVTALNDSNRVIEALSTGANDYVTKPIDFPVALARVEAQLQRRLADQQIRKNEERLALAASGANEGLFDWNLETGEISVSELWKEQSGLGRSSGNLYEEWLEHLHPKDAAALKEHLRKWSKPGSSKRMECEQRIRQANGSWRWIHLRATLQKSVQGAGNRLVGSISDITLSTAYDPTTGLGNRRMLLQCLEDSGPGATVVLLSLDRYKMVEDNLGPAAGTTFVEEIAARIDNELVHFEGAQGYRRPMLARLEAEQFGVLVGPEWSSMELDRLMRRLCCAIEQPLIIAERKLFTSAHVGIAMLDASHEEAEAVLLDATTALGQARLAGRGRTVRFEAKLRGRALEQMELEIDLQNALERNEFMVYYQPKVELASGRLRGFEALLRWRHPSKGLIPPDIFIPVAEQCGFMIPLGNWVLKEACQTMQAWLKEFPRLGHLVISVNVSAYQVKDGNMVERVEQVLRKTGLAPRSLHLEVTESAFIADTKETMRVFGQLKHLGVELNLDDFGTGYSSLQYLSDMKFDALKIDKSFLKNLVADEHANEIVKSMLGMARSLDMDVVAEGVETEDQLERLRMLGCKYGQGYLFSRPVPQEQAHEIMRREAESA